MAKKNVKSTSLVLAELSRYLKFVTELTKVPIDNKSGIVQPIAVANSVKPNTCLVSVMMANNETGVIMVSITNLVPFMFLINVVIQFVT